MFQIGFQITRNERIGLIKGCFDDNAGVTLYAEHYIHGRAIKRKYMMVTIRHTVSQWIEYTDNNRMTKMYHL